MTDSTMPLTADRVQLQFRLRRELRDQLYAEADQRGVSVNFMINRAIEDFLERLLPVEEVVWTKPE